MRPIFIIGIVLLLLLAPVFAQEIDIKIDPQNQTTDFKKEAEFSVQVYNNQNKTDSFSLSGSGYYTYWVSFYNSTLNIENNSSQSTRFLLFPTNDVGRFVYTITAVSKSNSSINATKDVLLTVVPDGGVFLKDYVFWHWPGKVSVNLFVKTLDKKSVKAKMEILDANRTVVEETSADKDIEGDGNIFEYIEFGSLQSGRYKIKTTVDGTPIEKIEEIEISADRNVTVKRDVTTSPFYDEIKIVVTNLGNSPEKDYKVFEPLAKGTPVNFITKVSGSEEQGNLVNYEFNIEELKSGDTVEIVYRIEYWKGILITVSIIIIAVIVMLWYLNRLRNPRIRKTYLKKKTGFTVVLEIRGSMFNHLTNVTVRDWVSSLAKVQQNFETLKPVVRSSAVGTELIWKLGDLKKGEDRVIHYDIIPVQLGTIKLDKAWLRYSKTEDKQYKKFSNVVVVEAGK